MYGSRYIQVPSLSAPPLTRTSPMLTIAKWTAYAAAGLVCLVVMIEGHAIWQAKR